MKKYLLIVIVLALSNCSATKPKYDVNNNKEAVIEFLKKDGGIDRTFEYGDTLLIAAVKQQNLKMVEVLLNYKADINKANDAGLAPIHIAVARNNKEILKILLADKNIDVNQINQADANNMTPLCLAVATNHIEMVKILIADPRINLYQTTKEGATALDIAYSEGHKDIAKTLEGVMKIVK